MTSKKMRKHKNNRVTITSELSCPPAEERDACFPSNHVLPFFSEEIKTADYSWEEMYRLQGCEIPKY